MTFQSTLSVGRATRYLSDKANGREFQSTLSVGRATRAFSFKGSLSIFQSTLSVGRATFQLLRVFPCS